MVRFCCLLSFVATLCAAAGLATAGQPARVLFANRADKNVTVIDSETFEELAIIDIQLGAHELGVSPNGRLAIGSAYGSGHHHKDPDNRVVVFDLVEHRVLHIIDLGEHFRPNDIVFCADNRHALVTTEAKQSLLRIDAEKGVVADVIPLPYKAGHMLAAGVDCNRAYVSHVVDGKVSVVDLEQGKVIGTVDAAFGAEGICIAPDNSAVWVANNRSDSITVFDPNTLTAIETFECKGFPFRIRFSPDSKLVAATCPMTDEIVVYDARARKEHLRINLARAGLGDGAQPEGIAFAPDGSSLVVACPSVRKVISVDIERGSIIHEFATGNGLDALTTAPPTTKS